ncbi:LysR substrate-binding domain-containing protein [Bordetella bronchiseptica]
MNRLPKHVTLKHLTAFVAVAQESSFTHAARRLFQTQSSVTTLVRQLETALGTQLFARTSRKVLLSAAGQDFLPRVMRLLADFDGVIEDVVRYGALERGRVSVAAAPSAITQLIAPAAADFARRHPAIRLYLRDDNSGRIQRQVAAQEVDFGLTSRWADAPGLAFDPLLEDRFGVLYRADDTSIQPGRDGHVRWERLSHRKLVGVVDETGIMALLRARADLPIEAAAPFYEASSTTSQAALVKAGLGVALLPALAAGPLSATQLRGLHDTVAAALARADGAALGDGHCHPLAQIRAYIDACLHDQGFGYEAVCQRFALSRSTLFRLFKAHGGFARYLKMRRMQQCFDLLTSERMRHDNVKAVYLSCGFDNAQQFSRVFSGVYGVAPSVLRQLTRQRFHAG